MNKAKLVFLPGFMCGESLFKQQIGILCNIGIECHVPSLTKNSSISEMASAVLKEVREIMSGHSR